MRAFVFVFPLTLKISGLESVQGLFEVSGVGFGGDGALCCRETGFFASCHAPAFQIVPLRWPQRSVEGVCTTVRFKAYRVKAGKPKQDTGVAASLCKVLLNERSMNVYKDFHRRTGHR